MNANLTLDEAHRLLLGAREEASRRGISVSIAVVDSGGHLLSFDRMSGAVLASTETSQVKARTAVLFGAPTRVFPADRPIATALVGGVGFPIGLFPGGIPIRRAGELIGAIGVGGSTAEDDDACATAGTATITHE